MLAVSCACFERIRTQNRIPLLLDALRHETVATAALDQPGGGRAALWQGVRILAIAPDAEIVTADVKIIMPHKGMEVSTAGLNGSLTIREDPCVSAGRLSGMEPAATASGNSAPDHDLPRARRESG
jgi:hypothetical protein